MTRRERCAHKGRLYCRTTGLVSLLHLNWPLFFCFIHLIHFLFRWLSQIHQEFQCDFFCLIYLWIFFLDKNQEYFPLSNFKEPGRSFEELKDIWWKVKPNSQNRTDGCMHVKSHYNNKRNSLMANFSWQLDFAHILTLNTSLSLTTSNREHFFFKWSQHFRGLHQQSATFFSDNEVEGGRERSCSENNLTRPGRGSHNKSQTKLPLK